MPETVLSRWVQFSEGSRKTGYHNPNRGLLHLFDDRFATSLPAVHLGVSGNTELGAMNRLRELPSLSLQARWRLAAAYAIAGRKEVANSLVFNATDEVEEYSFNNATYGSPGRDQAMILETYLLLDNVEKAMQLAPSVARSLSSGYITTQTASFGLIAMAQLAERVGSGNINVDWTLNGRQMESVNTPKAIHQVDVKPESHLSVTLVNKGEGQLYAHSRHEQCPPLTPS